MTSEVEQKERDSNIELFRIIVMLSIVAHHYVVNSGILSEMYEYPSCSKTYFLWLFGMWGKTGINCFVLITGWFMCKSKITVRKFLKLFFEILFYNVSINTVFYLFEYKEFYWGGLLRMLWPIWSVSDDFTSCYLLFFLFIPFLNILIQNINKRQHLFLLILTLGIYTGLGTVPFINVTMNYVTWFSVLYILASFIRIYPFKLYENTLFWECMTLGSVFLSMISVYLLARYNIVGEFLGWDIVLSPPYFFVSDSNKILAVIVALSSFMWFKNLRIKQSRVINTVAGSTFGVLLIHANSDTMRQWLWKDVLDCVGQYNYSFFHLVGTSFASVSVVFVACIIIDRLRIVLFEKPFFSWYDKHLLVGHRRIFS